MMGIVVPETCLASNKICNKKPLLHLVGILFPHIDDDARSKSHQKCYIRSLFFLGHDFSLAGFYFHQQMAFVAFIFDYLVFIEYF